jgi:type I restriction enzyme S subunit
MYPTMRFDDFVEVNPKVRLTKGEEYPFVEMAIVTPGRRYVSTKTKRTYKGGGARFQTGDILFARITPCLEHGKIAQYSGKDGEAGFGSTEFFVFRHRDGISDPGYVVYLARTDIVRKPAEKSMSGASGRQRADLNTVKDLQVPAPPLPTQRKIAAILSAYDDLIENNTRRIAILEEMARLLYREWFVHFRFPGHEQVKMVDSPLGPIPKGWEVVKFSDIVTLLRRGIKPHEFGDETFAHYSFPAFDTGCMPLLERGETIRSSKYLVDKDNVLLSKLNPRIPRIWLPFPDSDYRAIASTEFLVLLPKKSPTRSYLFSLCRSSEFLGDFAALTLGTSTSHQRVKPQDFLNMDTVLPPQTLIGAFSDLANPMLETIHTLRLKNANFRRTRDLLLPRLISGEVDVLELKINAGGLDDD